MRWEANPTDERYVLGHIQPPSVEMFDRYSSDCVSMPLGWVRSVVYLGQLKSKHY